MSKERRPEGEAKTLIDWTLASEEAVRWAREHGAELPQVTDEMREPLRQELAKWLETPGSTVGDLMQVLQDDFGFNESVAQMIAVTETTKAYQKGHETDYAEAGIPGVVYGPPAHLGCRCWTAADMLPNFDWVVLWRTNNDHLVCTQSIDTPFGAVAGCRDLEDRVVSEGPYLGMTLSEAREMAEETE